MSVFGVVLVLFWGFIPSLSSLCPCVQLVIRCHLSDESSKTMMVDERQTVRQVLDSLLDKSHCGYSPDWALVETIPELQMGESHDTHTHTHTLALTHTHIHCVCF